MNNSKVLDLRHLAPYIAHNPGLVAELAGLFRQGAFGLLAGLEASLASRAPEEWGRQLHTLKGLALSMGAQVLAERVAAAEAVPPSALALSGLRAAVAECESALKLRGH